MAVICFDLDGTLVDSAADLATAANVVLRGLGRPPLPVAAIRTMVGGGARALLARALEATGGVPAGLDLDSLGTWFMEAYRSVLTDETVSFPGTEEALVRCIERGHRLAVTTNKPTASAVAILDTLCLSSRFEVVIGGDAVPTKKPDPAMLYAAIEALGGGAAVLVGDSPADVGAARRAGIGVVAVAWGYRQVSLDELAADVVICSFGELDDALVSLLNAG